MNKNGFTLIELLIVVAIIGILAAIAVPNFLQAQTQAKISRMYSDMRIIGLALETYHLDHKTYPRQGPMNTCNIVLHGLAELTTPIAYLPNYPIDTFHRDDEHILQPIQYGICNSENKYWYTWSLGPDEKNQYADLIYDISNGLTSNGDLRRTTANGS